VLAKIEARYEIETITVFCPPTTVRGETCEYPGELCPDEHPLKPQRAQCRLDIAAIENVPLRVQIATDAWA